MGKGKRTVTSNTDQPNNLSKEKKNQRDTKKRAEVNLIREKKNVDKADMKQKSIDSKLKKQENVVETKAEIKTKNKAEVFKQNVKKEQMSSSSDISNVVLTDSKVQKERNKDALQNLDATTTLEKI